MADLAVRCLPKPKVRVLLALVLSLCLKAVPCPAVAVVQGQPVPTFKAYANQIQVPVLVLNAAHKRLKRDIANRFSIRIDSGPSFRPEHVRREADDPLSLSILIDTGRSQEGLFGKLSEAISELAPSSLTSRDHVSIYALGCDFVRTLSDAPADRTQLRNASAQALRAWIGERRSSRKESCGQAVHLWDALSFVTSDLATRPGRRVVLVVSNGHDEGSKNKWNELRNYAHYNGITLFGLTCAADYATCAKTGSSGVEDLFVRLCELSGGTVFEATSFDVGDQFKLFITVLRERYILEFPRPWNATNGQHSLVVSVDKSDDFVRVSGTVVPVFDQRLANDPATIPSDPSLTPTIGPRRPLPPPQ